MGGGGGDRDLFETVNEIESEEQIGENKSGSCTEIIKQIRL